MAAPSNTEARRAGIDDKATVRQALIDWRDEALKTDPPPWDRVVLLSHAIWWLSDDPYGGTELVS